MTTNIRAWGNSQGLYIPKKLLSEAAIDVNDTVELSVVDGGIMIRKSGHADKRQKAMDSLREIRDAHKGSHAGINNDYRAERNEYLDERYSK